MIWLDFKIFGNGRGMAMPHFDGRLYWLVDTYQKDRVARNGAFYTFHYGFGAQLSSCQWTHPNAGEIRKLIGREFRPLSSIRRRGRIRVSWSMSLPKDIDKAHAEIRALKADLDSALMERNAAMEAHGADRN